MDSIVSFLRVIAQQTPNKTLFTFLDIEGKITESYTYQEFENRTNFLAATLQAEGKIQFGKPVLLLYFPGLEMISAFFASIKVGAIPVPIPPLNRSSGDNAIDRLIDMAADCGARTVLSDEKQAAYFYSTLKREDHKNLDWVNTYPIKGQLDYFEISTNPLLFIQYTSGSTHNPHGVMISHDNVISNALADKQVNEGDSVISWLPHFHDMGLIGCHLFPVISGGTGYYFSPLDFLRKPLLWFEMITRYRINRTNAPNFAFDYCLREDILPTASLQHIDLSSVKNMMNGAEPVRAHTMNQFLAKFKNTGLNPKSLMVGYGLAEHTLCVSQGGRVQLNLNKHYLDRGQLQVVSPDELHNTIRIVSCGSPLPGVDVRIVDPHTRGLKREGGVGEIWVTSKSKASGYWGKPALSESIFQAKIIDLKSNQGYLRTGDIGFMHDGELYVSGRLKDMIIIRGSNIFPADIEAEIEAYFSTIEKGQVVVFATTDEMSGENGITLLIEAQNMEQMPKLAQIHRFVVENCPAPVHTLAYVPRGSIYKTSSGKIARQKCKQQWLARKITSLESLSPPERDLSVLPLEDYLDNLLAMRDINLDDMTITVGQLGLDSLELVTLSLKIEALAQQYNALTIQLSDKLSDLRLLQSIPVNQLKSIANQIRLGLMDSQQFAIKYNESFQSVVQKESIRMKMDSVLPENIKPLGNFVSPAQKTVLLTGGTGFLGSFLAESLLRLTDDKLLLLVRAHDDDHAKRRVEGVLKKTGISEDNLKHFFNTRLELLCGDITLPQFGLSEVIWQNLANRVTTIYHCAAAVDYIKPYDKLFNVNVKGMIEVLRLTCIGIPKELQYISTTFILGWTSVERVYEHECNAMMNGLDFGYSQTKWVAEQLIFEAQSKGLAVNVFRPSFITAAKNGEYIRSDIATRFLGYMIRKGVSTNAINPLSLIPVDICANNIVSIAKLNRFSITYHVTACEYYTISAVTHIIHHLFGYTFECFNFDKFVDHINAYCTQEDDLYLLVPFLSNHTKEIITMGNTHYDNQNYLHACQVSTDALAEPPLEDTVRWIVLFLKREMLIP